MALFPRIRGHIALLALAVIAKGAVRSPFVGIAVFNAGRPRKGKYDGMARGRAYAALPLTAKTGLNIPAAIIGPADNNPPFPLTNRSVSLGI